MTVIEENTVKMEKLSHSLRFPQLAFHFKIILTYEEIFWMDYYNFAFFFFFACLLPLSKPLHNSEAEDINLLLYLLDLCPLDLVGGSGLKHWTQWMDLQRTKGSSGLMAPRAGS